MFTEQQNAELAKPLASTNVKHRNQGGSQVSYIEGWHAIAEANRIFGFGGWSRETVEWKCVSERERMIGKTETKPGWPGFGVSYIAKVRVRVGELVREGCGTGHGIDRDLGQAHESALKEAETDAMKRALMTFGNVFGLALYDKTQANVADEPPAPQFMPEPQATKAKNELLENVKGCVTSEELRAYVKTAAFKSVSDALPEAHYEEVRRAVKDRFPAKQKQKEPA